jgi:2-keto-4-pentenoate hydratase/2-oxohepta-3-ene-1,7-dioic acid hydratase in catechol pathway
MFLARFSLEKTEQFGVVVGEKIFALKATSLDWSVPTLEKLGQTASQEVLATTSEVRFLPPLKRPSKILCVGVNYPERNEEYKDGQEAPPFPSLFPRFLQSFVGHNEPLIRPIQLSNQLDYEGEIALVIGKWGRHIKEADALNHVSALMLVNEGTIRDYVRHAKFNVTQGKNFDKSGSMGFLVPYKNESQIADIELTTKVNGELRQQDRTSRMIFNFRYLIAYISSFTTLNAGDILICGTPTGAGARLTPPQFLKPGDVVEIAALGLGTLKNTVQDEVR